MFPNCKIISFSLRCQIFLGAKLSSFTLWCQIVLVPNCPRCQIVLGAKLSYNRPPPPIKNQANAHLRGPCGPKNQPSFLPIDWADLTSHITILISCVNSNCIQCCPDLNLSFNLGSLYKQLLVPQMEFPAAFSISLPTTSNFR